MPGVLCTRGLVCKKKTHELVTTGPPKTIRHSLRDGVTVSFVISPVCRALIATVAGVTH